MRLCVVHFKVFWLVLKNSLSLPNLLLFITILDTTNDILAVWNCVWFWSFTFGSSDRLDTNSLRKAKIVDVPLRIFFNLPSYFSQMTLSCWLQIFLLITSFLDQTVSAPAWLLGFPLAVNSRGDMLCSMNDWLAAIKTHTVPPWPYLPPWIMHCWLVMTRLKHYLNLC